MKSLAVRRMISFTVLACVAVGGIAHRAFCGDSAFVTIRSGAAYDYFSQRYFVDSLVTSGADTTLESWEFSRKYLNDFRFWFSADYPGKGNLKSRVQLLGEISDEQWRLRLSPVYTRTIRQSTLASGMEVERRKRFHGTPVSGDSYWFAVGRSRLSVPIGCTVRAVTGIVGDAVKFDSATTSALSYWRIGGSAGMELDFGNFSLLSIHLFGAKRKVPDSTWLGYQSLGAEGSLSWGHDRGDISAAFRVEDRTYDDPDGIDDHFRIDGYFRSKTEVRSKWFIFADADGEAALYDNDNFLNQSVGRVRAAVLAGFKVSEVSSLSLGPHLEWLDERAGLIPVTPDYLEKGVRFDADILAGSALFAALQSVTGNHNLTQPSESSSSFRFQRITLLGDGQVVGRLNISLFWSVEWEWHDREADDSFSHFLSASLSQKF